MRTVAFCRVSTNIQEYERQINELSDRSAKLLTDAKAAHDEIEKYYIHAMDFAALDQISDKFIADLTAPEGKQV